MTKDNFEKGYGVRADNLVAIADYFGVSTDYLLGRTKSKAIEGDMRMTCDMTGLSERAIKEIQKPPTVIGITLPKEEMSILTETSDKKTKPAQKTIDNANSIVMGEIDKLKMADGLRAKTLDKMLTELPEIIDDITSILFSTSLDKAIDIEIEIDGETFSLAHETGLIMNGMVQQLSRHVIALREHIEKERG